MPGTHKHQCHRCKAVWEHSDDCAGNTEAHTCTTPGCNTEAWAGYFGDRQGSVHPVACTPLGEQGAFEMVLSAMITDSMVIELIREVIDDTFSFHEIIMAALWSFKMSPPIRYVSKDADYDFNPYLRK